MVFGFCCVELHGSFCFLCESIWLGFVYCLCHNWILFTGLCFFFCFAYPFLILMGLVVLVVMGLVFGLQWLFIPEFRNDRKSLIEKRFFNMKK